ncbi:MAG: hypothetical protein AB9915_03920 [Candidatus Dojkabacteria bacterium]
MGIFDPRVYDHDFPKFVQEVARVLKEKGIFSICDWTTPPKEELEKYFKRISAIEKEYPTLWEKK